MVGNYYVHNGQLYKTNELKHWKYIKKERVNGRWRYYYDDGGQKGEILNPRANPNSPYGTYYMTKSMIPSNLKKVQVNKSNNLFSTEKSIDTNKDGFADTTIRNIGKLERSIDKARNWVESLFDRTYRDSGTNETFTVKGKISKTIDKAKKWLSDLFK